MHNSLADSAQAPVAWERSSLGRSARRHPSLALLVGCLVLAVFSSAWILMQSPDFFGGYDFLRMHAFYKAYFRDGLLSGRLPLWNPFVGLGRPFLADIETQTLYPPNLLVLPFGVTGGIALALVLHQTIAIYCGTRLGRVLGAGSLQSLLLGAGLVLASPFTARLATGMVPVYFALCWWPALLWLGASLQDQWNRGKAAGFAAAVALAILAGNPPILFVEVFGLIVFLAARLQWPTHPRARLGVLRNLLGVAFAGLLGAGLAAAQILPFAELVGQGNRPLHSAAFAVANGMPPASWLSLIYPTSEAFGPNWEFDLYCGLVPLFAAAGAITLWRERNVRALLALGAFGVLLACGDRTPFLGWIVHWVPGAVALRLPSRYGIWLATALLGLAAVALSRRTAGNGVPAAVLAAAVALIIWLRPYVAVEPGQGALYYAVHICALSGAALLVGSWNLRARWPLVGTVLGCALGAFCAGDWLWAIRLQSPVYSAYGFHNDERMVRAVLQQSGLFVAGGPPPRIAFSPSDVRENSGMTEGYGTYTSYVNPALDRVWSYLHIAGGFAPSATDFIRLPQSITEDPGRLDSLNLAANVQRGGRALEIRPRPDPRAYIVFAVQEMPDWRAAEVEMVARNRFHQVALVERGGAPDFSPAGGSHAGMAAITGFEPERVRLRTRADGPGVLVLAEAWYPGWTATVSGRPARVFPVNGWMRGVVVPQGDSDVVFTFRSRLLGLGLGVSAASAALVAALGAWPRRPAAA